MWCYRTEPPLDEVMHEPVIRLMMERDHVTEEALVRIIDIGRLTLHASDWKLSHGLE
jgi:hypothetical protein